MGLLHAFAHPLVCLLLPLTDVVADGIEAAEAAQTRWVSHMPNVT
jgi:hypothetical protein